MEDVKRIYSLLLHSNGLKIRDVSKELDLDKYYVAEVLFSTENIPYWYQDDETLWYAKEGAIHIEEKKEDRLITPLKKPKKINVKRFLQDNPSETLRSIIDQLSLFRTYTESELLELIRRYRDGDHKAFELLVKSQQKLATYLAFLYKKDGVLLEDIIQEGNIGLLTAIERFDSSQFNSFTGYAKAWILQAISASMIYLPYLVRLSISQFTLFKRIQKQKEKFEQENEYPPSIYDINVGEDVGVNRIVFLCKLPSDLRDLTFFVDDYESFEDNSNMPDEGLMEESTRIYVKGLLSHLSKREGHILHAFYGLYGTPPETLEQIGQKYGLTRERVRQIKEKSIRKLQIFVGVRKKEKKETEYKLYTKKEKKQQSVILSEEQIEHRVNTFTLNNPVIQHYIPQLPVENEREKGTSYYSEYLSMREQAQTQQRTNQSLKDSILLVLQQCKMPISLREIVSRVNRSYFVVRTESVEYLLRSMSEVECMTDGRYKLKKEENEILQKEKRTEKTELPFTVSTSTTGTFTFKLSTPLMQLVRKKILTPKENKRCRNKGLYTIGDVKRIIETYHLTRKSTRFTQYTINLWFKIVGLLETDIPEKIEEKPKDVQQNQQPINFEEAYYKKYSKIFLEIRQAIVYGKEIIAKPVLLLAVIDGINEGRFVKNHIYLNEWLDTRYKALMYKYGNLKLSTEINMPFWHMKNDGFWHLQFVESQKEKRFTPSKNWLRRNVKYAYLDEALWILLENKEWRMKLRDFIVEHKLNPQV